MLTVFCVESESVSFRADSGIKQGCVCGVPLDLVWGNEITENGVGKIGSKIFRESERMEIT